MSREATRYWDACAFLGWLNEEIDKVADCESVIRAAERGDVRIVTSAVTLTEVVKIKGRQRLKQSDEQKIARFFENSYITVINLDRFVGEKARHLIWQFPTLKPKDALHLASAIEADCPYLDTFDSDLLGLDGQLAGVLIHIGRPHVPHQNKFPLVNTEDGG